MERVYRLQTMSLNVEFIEFLIRHSLAYMLASMLIILNSIQKK